MSIDSDVYERQSRQYWAVCEGIADGIPAKFSRTSKRSYMTEYEARRAQYDMKDEFDRWLWELRSRTGLTPDATLKFGIRIETVTTITTTVTSWTGDSYSPKEQV